jgi:arylsulfatase A-like enzyme
LTAEPLHQHRNRRACRLAGVTSLQLGYNSRLPVMWFPNRTRFLRKIDLMARSVPGVHTGTRSQFASGTQAMVAQVLAVLVLALLGALHPSESRAQSSDAPQINVVFILADDLGWGELGCYGQEKIPTPNIDRLASQGMRFTQHYSGAPVCAPSRCVLMTGKHLGHAEVRGNMQAKKIDPRFDEGQYPISTAARTIAMAFRDSGYATGAMGKWGLGPVSSTGDPNAKGFDLFFGYNCQAVAHSYYPAHLWRNDEKIVINADPIPGHRKQPDGPVTMEDWIGQTYAPALMIAEAEQFIDRHANEPFFLYLPFIEPHVAMHPPVESVRRFPESWDDQVYRGQCGYLPHPRPHAGYAAMISDLDGYVGKVLDRLEESNLTDKTLVIFTSDNGTTHPGNKETHFHIGGADAAFFNSTAGLRGFKGSVYEGGIRVPMVARLPGVIPAGTTCDQPSYFADWFPTLADAVGLEPPSGLDGESFWPQMCGGDTTRRQTPMVWVFPEYGGQVAIRVEDYKLVRQELKSKRPPAWQLYDLRADPGETNDLAVKHPDVVDRLSDMLRSQTSENRAFPVLIPDA